MCHRAPCALRLPKSSAGALRAPTPGTLPRPPGGSACNGSHCVVRFRFGSLAPIRPKGLPKQENDTLRELAGSRQKTPEALPNKRLQAV